MWVNSKAQRTNFRAQARKTNSPFFVLRINRLVSSDQPGKGPPGCSANRANPVYNFIFARSRCTFAHPGMRKVGAWGLRRLRALTIMFLLFWPRPPPPNQRPEGGPHQKHRGGEA